MSNPVPHAVIDYSVYLNGTEMLGVVEATLPDLETASEELKGAGVMGAIDVPVKGQFGPMGLTLNFRRANKNVIKLAEQKIHMLDLRAAGQNLDVAGNTLGVEKIQIEASVIPKKTALGKLATGEVMDASLEFEVVAIKYTLDGKVVVDIDKANYKAVINGNDQVADVRAALGK